MVTNVERLRQSVGLGIPELIEATGLSRSYYQSRIRGELPFNTNDIELLARVLGVNPGELADPGLVVAEEVEVDGDLLAARLARLAAGEEPQAVSRRLARDGVAITLSEWNSLLKLSGSHTVSSALLSAIAASFDVDPTYLTDTSNGESAERVEALLDVRDAMKANGIASIHMRAVGEAPPKALRAIAEALHSLEDNDS